MWVLECSDLNSCITTPFPACTHMHTPCGCHQVTLKELYNGKTSKMALTKDVLCKTCEGRGGKKVRKSTVCCRACCVCWEMQACIAVNGACIILCASVLNIVCVVFEWSCSSFPSCPHQGAVQKCASCKGSGMEVSILVCAVCVCAAMGQTQ